MKTTSVFLFIMVSSFCLRPAEAKPFNDIEWGLLQLERIALKTQIVESDMRLCIDRPDFSRDRKEASKDAQASLEVIRKDLKVLVLPSDIESLRPLYESSINRLENLYKNLDKKSEKEIRKEVDDYWKFVDTFNNQIKAADAKWFVVPPASKDFNYLDADLKSFKDKKDREDFLKADSWINLGKSGANMIQKRDEAWKIYKRLYKAYSGKEIEGTVLAGLIQTSEMMDNDKSDIRKSDPEKHAALIKKFLVSGRYSPSLFYLYIEWVPLEQINNGASNMSDIPNDMYLDIRWKIVKAIQKHLYKHPDDIWAKVQGMMLMDEPIIFRDCGNSCSYGNSFFEWMWRSFNVGDEPKVKADKNNVDMNKVGKIEAPEVVKGVK